MNKQTLDMILEGSDASLCNVCGNVMRVVFHMKTDEGHTRVQYECVEHRDETDDKTYTDLVKITSMKAMDLDIVLPHIVGRTEFGNVRRTDMSDRTTRFEVSPNGSGAAIINDNRSWVSGSGPIPDHVYRRTSKLWGEGMAEGMLPEIKDAGYERDATFNEKVKHYISDPLGKDLKRLFIGSPIGHLQLEAAKTICNRYLMRAHERGFITEDHDVSVFGRDGELQIELKVMPPMSIQSIKVDLLVS